MNVNWFNQHVSHNISAYLHGELTIAATNDLEAHLNECSSCLEELEEIRLGMKIAEKIEVVSSPPILWQELNELRNKVSQQTPNIWKYAMAATLILIFGWIGWIGVSRKHRNKLLNSTENIAVVPVTSAPPSSHEKAWEVTSVGGAMHIGDEQISGSSKLKIGEWLETDNESSAKIKVADIGVIKIESNSRLQLVNTDTKEHRISLAQGKMSALIFAPPRLFIVDTPAATAVDLGCSYTLEVDKNGTSYLQVTSGWVSFVRDGQESFVPAGAKCEMKKGSVSGTPYFSDAAENFKSALQALSYEQEAQVPQRVKEVLLSAREKDALSLWHLLGSREVNLSKEIRQQIYDRLFQFAPHPVGVTRKGILNQSPEMLKIWWEERIR